MRLGALLFALLIALASIPIITANAEVNAIPLEGTSPASISIDGDVGDWGTYTCTSSNTYVYATINGIPQWIWCDDVRDERTDFSTPDPRADLVQFRVTANSTHLLLLYVFNYMSNTYIGDDGATFIALTINRNGEGSGTWFAGESETQVNTNYAKWAYQVVVNLADSRYRGQGLKSGVFDLTQNWGGILYIVDSSWSFVSGSGAAVGVSISQNSVEVAVPWGMIGGTPSGGSFYLRLSLITARGWSNFNGNSGGAWDIFGSSDALDAMTDKGPNTWDEVGDGVVDYYADVYFTTSPPFYPIPEPGIVALIASGGGVGGLFYVLRRRKLFK